MGLQGRQLVREPWYNGPWAWWMPEFVPVYMLRVPVRYYRSAPGVFLRAGAPIRHRTGASTGAPRGHEHRCRLGPMESRLGRPRPAPLPVYQRQYSGNDIQIEEQYVLQSRNYHYQPRDAVVRQTLAAQRTQEPRMAGPRAPERTTHPSATQPWPPRAQGAPVPTPSRASAAPKATQQTQREPNAAKAPPRPSHDGRNSARRATRGGPPPAVAQDRTPQRAQPPQKGGANPPRDVANASRPTVIAQQAQRPQPQHSEAPRGPEPRKGQERGRDKDERQGAEHNK